MSMKVFALTIVSFTLILNSSVFPQSIQVTGASESVYEEGLREKGFGNWREALRIWFDAKENLYQQKAADPRIGFAYIELATEKEDIKNFVKASEHYFWGLENKDLDSNFDIYLEEIERIKPLVNENTYSQWISLLNGKNPHVLTEIKKFWIELDPTPSTPANERLLEHWTRIAFARKHFTENDNTIYGTDDRGILHIKYGQPEKIYGGVFGDEIGYKRYGHLKRKSKYSSTIIYPEFELWIYKDLVRKDTVRYFFGKEKGEGEYGLRYGVEDFIPRNLFYESGNFAGYRLQSTYYHQLQDVDEFFYYRLLELSEFTVLPRNLQRYSYAAYDKNDPAKKKAPVKKSYYDDEIKPIDIQYYQVRLLDDNNKPVVAVIGFSMPKNQEENAETNLVRFENTLVPQLNHTVIIRDEDWNEIMRAEDYPVRNFINASTFTFPHLRENFNNAFVAESINLTTTENGVFDKGNEEIFGEVAAGKRILDMLSPLSNDRAELEVSDIIIGPETPDEVKSLIAPFPVVPATEITRDKWINVYLEVYHLQFNAENKALFEVSYQITRKGKKGFLNKLFFRGGDKQVSSTKTTFESLVPTAKEIIAFDISTLKSGEYSLLVEVTDIFSGQTKARTGEFTLHNSALKK